MLFATVKGMTIKFLRQQEYVRREVFETVAGVVNLQVAGRIYQCSRVQTPYGRWVTMHFIEFWLVWTSFSSKHSSQTEIVEKHWPAWVILQLSIWRHIQEVQREARNCRCRIAK